MNLGWRHGMSFLGFTGFFIVYALRVNLSVALVSMVNHTAIGENAPRNINASFHDRCVSPSSNSSGGGGGISDGRFVWDEYEQGLILGSFYYGYIVTQIPGGWLAGRIGGKWVFGIGILWTSVLTILTPLAANAGFTWLIVLRVLEGLGEGVTFPSMHAIWGQWSPPLERSILPAFCYSGTMVGTVVAFIVSGYLCASDFLGGWPAVFYIFGGLGIVWFAFWAVLAGSTPRTHRYISASEKDFIEGELAKERNAKDVAMRPPWLRIAGSIPMWAIIVSHTGDNWGTYTFLTELPQYLETILGFNISDDGVLSALPYLLRALVTYAAAFGVDGLRSRYNVSTTLVRRWSDVAGKTCAGLLLVVVAFSGCNAGLSVGILILAVGFTGLSQTGYAVNHLDIAPRYAGVLFGISNSFATLPGFLGPLVAGAITNNNDTLSAWRAVFLISAGIYFVSAAFYCWAVSGDVQPWAQEEETPIPLAHKARAAARHRNPKRNKY